jgi:hypothetical protein
MRRVVCNGMGYSVQPLLIAVSQDSMGIIYANQYLVDARSCDHIYFGDTHLVVGSQMHTRRLDR